MDFDHNRVIIHLDIDAFYAQVEEMLRPELKSKPIGVYQKTIIVTSNYVAREYGIKKCMLTTEAIKLCPNLILVNGENLEKYREISHNITRFIQDTYKTDVEKLGFDENFVDITKLVQNKLNLSEEHDAKILIGTQIVNNSISVDNSSDEDFGMNTECCLTFGENGYESKSFQKRKSSEQNSEKTIKVKTDSGVKDFDSLINTSYSSSFDKESSRLDFVVGHTYKNTKGKCHCGCIKRLIIGTHIASDIRKSIFEMFNLTLSAGISYNKLLAKLVGSINKPNKQTVIFPNSVLDLMSSIHLRQIPGIGSKVFLKLTELGITTVEQLQISDRNTLLKSFDGSMYEWLQNICFGKDNSQVKNFTKQNTIGVEDRYAKPISTCDDFKKQIKILLERLLILVKKDGRLPKLLKISLRFNHFKFEFRLDSKQCPINPRIFSHSNLEIIDYLLSTTVKLYKELCSRKNSQIVTYINITLGNFIELSKTNILNFCENKTRSSKCGNDSLLKNSMAQNFLTQDFGDCRGIDMETKNENKHINYITENFKLTNELLDNASIKIIEKKLDGSQNVQKKILQINQEKCNFSSNKPSTSTDIGDTYESSTNSTDQFLVISRSILSNNSENPSHNYSHTLDIANIDQAVLSELPDDIREEIETHMKRKLLDKPTVRECVIGTSESSALIDSDNFVDEEVLKELPEDIRKEIEADNKITKRTMGAKSYKTTHEKKCIKQLSILNFVKKK